MKATDVVKIVVMCAVVGLCAGCGKEETDRTKAREDVRSIWVEGRASVDLVPDTLTMEIGVVTLDNDAAKSQAANARITRAVLDLVGKVGIADDDVQTASMSLLPKWRDQEDKPPVFEGYESTSVITLVLRNMKQYDALSIGLVSAGVQSIRFMEFSSTREKEMLPELRRQALKDARARADLIVETLGEKIRRVESVGQEEHDIQSVGDRSHTLYFSPPAIESRNTAVPGKLRMVLTIDVTFALAD